MNSFAKFIIQSFIQVSLVATPVLVCKSTSAGELKDVMASGCGKKICYRVNGTRALTTDIRPLIVVPKGTLTIVHNQGTSQEKIQTFIGSDIAIDFKARYVTIEALENHAKKAIFIDLKDESIHYF